MPAERKRAAGIPRLQTVGLAVGSAALLIAGAGWYFTRGRPASTSPAIALTPPPTAAATPTIAASPAPVAPSRKSIAVLPFENLSGRPEDAYLADGLQEEILNALARLRDLKVISRTSVMEYRGKAHNIREIGQRLGVGTVLEGSVRREGNTLRLTVQLIDTRDDTHLFAANYDREISKVFDLQSAVARQVTEALAATMTRQDRGELDRVATNNGDAYDRYLRAVALFRQPVPGDFYGVVETKRQVQEALRFDPNFADAWALLSMANTLAFAGDRREENGAAAREAFERAFANDPKLPEALLARGLYATLVTGNLKQALVDLEAAVQARPNSAEAHHSLGLALRRVGRTEEALEHLQRAWDLDPLKEGYDGGAIVTLLALRRFPEAIQQTEIHSKRFPNDRGGYFARGRLQARLRNSSAPLHEALRDYGNLLKPAQRKAFEVEIAQAEGRYLEAIKILEEVPVDDLLSRGLQIGSLYQAAGDAFHAEENFRRAEVFALEQLQKEEADVDLIELAVVQSMLGKHAEALATIDVAQERLPESRDARNGPFVSCARSFVLVRAGRTQEGYAEATRLLRVPFGSPSGFVFGEPNYFSLLVKGDPLLDELINHPPRL